MSDPSRISGMNPSSQSASNVSPQRIQNKLGLYLGQKAMHNPYASSVMQEIAEEAPFFASEKIEKEMAKRQAAKERSKESKESKEKMDAQQLAEFYLGMSPDNSTPPESLLRFLNRLKQLNDPNAEKMLQEAEQEFEDVSDQYIALSFAEEALHNEGGDELSNLTADAKKLLMNESGPSVRAGLNAAADTLAAAKSGLGQVSDLRDFYRDIVLSHEGIIPVYQSIEKEYGAGRLPQALGFLIRAAGNDLSAQGPSIEPAHLRAIIDNLYQVEVLAGVHDNLGTLLQRLSGNFGIASEMNAEELMAALLNLSQNFQVDESNIQQLADKTGSILLDPRIYFLTAFNEQLRLVPLKIYPSQDQREKLLRASQEALDEVIYEEEQEEEQQQQEDQGDEDADDDNDSESA